MSAPKKSWSIAMTQFGVRTDNPLRKMWEGPKVYPNPLKNVISLQLGDPTIFGNFPPAQECIEALSDALQRDNFSYTVSAGMKSARQAVADYVNRNSGLSVTSSDVVLTSGCTVSLEICFRALAEPGENILVPKPAWNYSTWLHGSGIETKYYDLDPNDSWQVDLKHLVSQIDEKTRAILLNNPGNPCGNVFSKEHILDILEIANQFKLPIISDEVYEFFTFPGVKFHSVATLSKHVPVVTCSGLSKRFLLPGIRMGWIVINDRNDTLKYFKMGLENIVGRNFWPNSTTQLALPDILQKTPQSFLEDNPRKVFTNALSAFKILIDVPGLTPIMPQGAMYMMVNIDLDKFPEFGSCIEFAQELIREQSVLCLPGKCFGTENFLRLVLTVPSELIVEACLRIREFSETHFTLSKIH